MKKLQLLSIISTLLFCISNLSAQTTVSSKIGISIADSEENILNGSISLTSPDLDMMRDGTDDHEARIGLHFSGLNIPAGATIQDAYIQFTADEVHSGTISISIYAEAANDPAIWTTATNDISGRTKTTTEVTWSPADWDNIGDALAAQKTSDISTVIQELVDRTGYASSDAINIIMEYDTPGKRVAESYNGSPGDAPELFVTYDTGSSGGGSGSTVWDTSGNDINYSSGNVGIGASAIANYKLAVDGNIRSREVRVDSDTWADYVFTTDYDLPTLEEVKKHIDEMGRLPNIPSAKEVMANGIELGEMNKLLLEKIEELTLYVLQQQEQIDQLIKKEQKNDTSK